MSAFYLFEYLKLIILTFLELLYESITVSSYLSIYLSIYLSLTQSACAVECTDCISAELLNLLKAEWINNFIAIASMLTQARSGST